MTPEDAARLAAIHAEAFDAGWSAETIARLVDQVGVIALSEDAGFILIRVVADEAEILTLAVRPSARRCGVGARLVRQAADRARDDGAVRLFLEVAEDNTAARALYAACGYETVGRRPGYYVRPDGSNEAALILALNLSGALPTG